MQLTESKKKELTKKLLLSRLRILNDYGFYGLLLMHMNFKLDLDCNTAYTDGHVIAFSPDFLDSLTSMEVDFIMMHEILHVVLKHCFRGRTYNNMLFNIACDIVVNSNILKSHNMDLNSISVDGNVSMHLAPDGKEGYEYTAEEVYNMLLKKIPKNSTKKDISIYLGSDNIDTIDGHDHWIIDGNTSEEDEWEQRLINASEALQVANNKGSVPVGATRLIKQLKDSSVNWRELLHEFLSYEVCDYTFLPPDRRYDEFYLPDYNGNEEVLNINVLVEIDTSGSITNDELTMAYSEIKGLIDEAEGRLKGYLGFYDASAYDIKPFDSVSDILEIKPIGGGGTDVSTVFKRLDDFKDTIGDYPDLIIIITDGYDDFPKESVRRNIPVFWLINNDKMTPPWGIVARMKKQ